MVKFPAPVGGVPQPLDFAPSILFALLYALLVPLMVYRMLSRRSRTTLLIGTVTFSVERVVIYALRAVQAHNESRRFSHGLLTYMQISFAMGYLGIANDTINFLRCLLVNPTFGSDMFYQSPAAKTKGGLFQAPPEGTPDKPKSRFWSRRFIDFFRYAFFAAIIPGIVANSKFSKVLDNQGSADNTAKLRYVSSGVALGLVIGELLALGWALYRFHKKAVTRRGAVFLIVVVCLMAIVSIYRLSVMHFKMTSLEDPTILNKPGLKATFYIFQVLPEWLAMFILLSINARKTFSTGPFGDWRAVDKKEKKKAEDFEKKENGGDVGEAIEMQTATSTSALIHSEKKPEVEKSNERPSPV